MEFAVANCIAFVPSSFENGWTRCTTPAVKEDVFCRKHRQDACGIVLGLMNGDELVRDVTMVAREMAAIAGRYFAAERSKGKDL